MVQVLKETKYYEGNRLQDKKRAGVGVLSRRKAPTLLILHCGACGVLFSSSKFSVKQRSVWCALKGIRSGCQVKGLPGQGNLFRRFIIVQPTKPEDYKLKKN